MISDFAAVYAPRRFHCQLFNWFLVMICGFAATQFLLMISDSAVVYAR
jgi:hypothetical protein